MSAPILANTETHTPQSRRGLTRQHKNIPTHTAHRLVIEDFEGPEVTMQVLSDSLLQVTLRSKLYLSLQRWVCALGGRVLSPHLSRFQAAVQD